MNSTFIGPTKSLCRSGVGGSSGRTRRNIVIQQQKRHRHQHQRQQQKDKGRHAVCTPRLITRDTSKGTMCSLLSSSSSRPISIRAISTSSSTDNTQSKTNKITGALAMTAAATAAAGAVFLGVEQKKELQRKRENNETKSREGVTMTTTSVAAKTTTTTTRTRTVIDTTGFLSMVTPLFRHDRYNNIHDVRTATNNGFRSLTFSDLIAKVNTINNNNNNNNNNNAHTTSMEPLQRKTASSKNRLSPSQIHQPRNVMISRMRSVAGRGLHDKYNVDWKTVLGEGAYGSVHPARLALTGEKVALKKISKRYTNSSDFFTETDALLRIYDNGGHPNISGLRDMYEDSTHFYLVMDLITGGELFDHLSNDGAYSEADAARLVFEIASALAFMHGVGVIHGDIKPENLMLCSRKRRGGTIKIIDFGCAITQPVGHYDAAGAITDNDESSSSDNVGGPAETGTTGYWPPERFRGHKLTPNVDTWALGIIVYIMLMGFHPFDVDCDRSDEEVAAAIQKNPHPPMDEMHVGHLSESAKDLIRRLMESDPDKRMTAYELMHHEWVQGETASTEKIEDSDKRLSKFQDLRYKLEASVFAVLVNQGHANLTMSESKRKSTEAHRNSGVSIMKSVFDVFDKDGKGFVTGEDIGKVVTAQTGQELKTHDANEFLKDGNQQSELSLSDFSNLFSGMKHKHFPRGHYIFLAGDEGKSMYFLSSGKVEVQTRKGQLVAILRNGDFFGEGSLLDDDKKRFTTAKCATPVDVVEINREDFDRYTRSSVDTKTELKRKWRARSLVYAKNLLRFEQSLKARTLKKGDVVYREGDKGTAMFRVDDLEGGELEVLHGDVPVHKYFSGDSFGESSLLFVKPRSSTVRCVSDNCRIHEMSGEDFMAVVQSSPNSAAALRNMCRKRLFKRAVKQFSLETNRGLSDEDIVAAFHNADQSNSGYLNVDDVRRIMHRMDPKFPMSEIHELMKFVDVDDDGRVCLDEFKQIFRQFEDEKS